MKSKMLIILNTVALALNLMALDLMLPRRRPRPIAVRRPVVTMQDRALEARTLRQGRRLLPP